MRALARAHELLLGPKSTPGLAKKMLDLRPKVVLGSILPKAAEGFDPDNDPAQRVVLGSWCAKALEPVRTPADRDGRRSAWSVQSRRPGDCVRSPTPVKFGWQFTGAAKVQAPLTVRLRIGSRGSLSLQAPR